VLRIVARVTVAVSIVLIAGGLVGTSTAAAAPAGPPDAAGRIAALEQSRGMIIVRDQRLADLCRGGCATEDLDAAAGEVRRIDTAVLPAIEGAIRRLRSGREVTRAQQAAVLEFAVAEAGATARLRSAQRAAARPDTGDAAYRTGYAIGQLIGTLGLLAGVPVLAVVMVRRRVRRRSPG
jgi:hypothetical protein